MTEWWSIKPPANEDEKERPVEPVGSAPLTLAWGDESAGEAQSSRSRRGKAAKVAGGVAAVALIGVMAVGGTSGGDDRKPSGATFLTESVAPEVGSDGEFLPAAGGGPADVHPSPERPKVVTLQASHTGKGRIGSVMRVSIRNDTAKPVTVLASTVQGDGRPAIVGEGTLAPGSRVIQPGETAEGTVEFSALTAPRQVALIDLSGNVIAVSAEI